MATKKTKAELEKEIRTFKEELKALRIEIPILREEKSSVELLVNDLQGVVQNFRDQLKRHNEINVENHRKIRAMESEIDSGLTTNTKLRGKVKDKELTILTASIALNNIVQTNHPILALYTVEKNKGTIYSGNILADFNPTNIERALIILTNILSEKNRT